MIDITEFADNESISTLAEAIGLIYKGAILQVYWGESGGSTKYADYSINQNMFVEGRVLWGRGHVFALEVVTETNAKTYKKQVLFNDFSVTLVAEKVSDFNITAIFQGKI